MKTQINQLSQDTEQIAIHLGTAIEKVHYKTALDKNYNLNAQVDQMQKDVGLVADNVLDPAPSRNFEVAFCIHDFKTIWFV
jgi:hypothetical protein